MPRSWNLPLTYPQKIEAVRTGKCTQSIRFCTISKSKKHPGEIIRKQAGDRVRFYIWTGRPYWSHPERITEYMELVNVENCRIREEGIDDLRFQGEFGLWDWDELDRLAELDFINPPTGEALRDVLIGKNGKTPEEGAPAQILRWKWLP
jgi:hypothetical protein